MKLCAEIPVIIYEYNIIFNNYQYYHRKGMKTRVIVNYQNQTKLH